MAKQRYAIVIEKTPSGFSAYIPDIPGCIAVGKTVEETVANMQEALALFVEESRNVPAPKSRVAYVEVEV